MNEDITGYILAGGRSRRMGQDKRLIRFEGATLLESVIRLLETVLASPPVLVGDNLIGVAPTGYPILPDAQPDCGPLSGLISALTHCPTDWALVIGVDMPYLSANDLSKLIHAVHEDLDGVSLKAGPGIEPLAAIYAASTHAFWEKRLAMGKLSLQEGINLLKWGQVSLPQGSTALMNVNRPEDLLA